MGVISNNWVRICGEEPCLKCLLHSPTEMQRWAHQSDRSAVLGGTSGFNYNLFLWESQPFRLTPPLRKGGGRWKGVLPIQPAFPGPCQNEINVHRQLCNVNCGTAPPWKVMVSFIPGTEEQQILEKLVSWWAFVHHSSAQGFLSIYLKFSRLRHDQHLELGNSSMKDGGWGKQMCLVHCRTDINKHFCLSPLVPTAASLPHSHKSEPKMSPDTVKCSQGKQVCMYKIDQQWKNKQKRWLNLGTSRIHLLWQSHEGSVFSIPES